MKEGKKLHCPIDDPHLGGHCFITHLDEGILNYAINSLKIKSMLDIGCGPGGMVELATKLGIDAYGIEGDYRLESNNKIILHDFVKGKYQHNRIYDLAYSCEFVEHVEEQFVENFMFSFQCCNYAIITFAPPGTPGIHHVNCQSKDYWIDIFTKFNFIFDSTITEEFRRASTMQRDFIRNNGLFFRNCYV